MRRLVIGVLIEQIFFGALGIYSVCLSDLATWRCEVVCCTL